MSLHSYEMTDFMRKLTLQSERSYYSDKKNQFSKIANILRLLEEKNV